MSYFQDLRLLTGITGLDLILHGGVIPQRSYLIQGGAGTGKTTIGMHFLMAGPPAESLFVTLGEPKKQLRDNAKRCGLDINDISFLDVSPGHEEETSTPSLLESWDIEGNEVRDKIIDYVKKHRPKRILIDSLSQLRYLSVDIFQFRKQVLTMLRTLTASGATVVFTSEDGQDEGYEVLPFLSDGVINLEQTEYGRLCRITKLRGSGFEEGSHYYKLTEKGVMLYPRLVPNQFHRTATHSLMSSGIPEFDALTHGGIESGTVTLLSGPTGVGKTTLGAQLLCRSAEEGKRAVIYNFDESSSIFFTRCQQVGIPIEDMFNKGAIHFKAVEPLLYHPDQFAAEVRKQVEENGAKTVMIDSLSGYQQSMCGENLQARVHALCRYLANMDVTVILVNELYNITGDQAKVTEFGLSYVADNIIMLRYIELNGELNKTIGVLKKRAGSFERNLREFNITDKGFQIGEPLRGMRGLMSGVPEIIHPSSNSQ